MPGNWPGVEIAAVLNGIRREAAAAGLYERLVELAPDREQREGLQLALACKQGQLLRFIGLYRGLTGQEPVYAVEPIPFADYRDGLAKAGAIGAAGYEDYRLGGWGGAYGYLQHAFRQATLSEQQHMELLRGLGQPAIKDYGPQPLVIDIEEVTERNDTYRTAIWTGEHLQVTVMSIDPGADIGLEVHPHTDQFIRLEEGEGLVEMGKTKDNLTFRQKAGEDDAVMIPAGTWHNVTNTGDKPMKVYVIYAPPQHPRGTVHRTKADAMAAES
ncbi:cupin domain-containing protein [Paenibacillus sp. IB182496]|uniref:Cupin domain-containing protein n=2 Tax=Paenibacillus sabuli TaxID=2772509 RepID=A0A927BW42_9BACL|nr:cupin domain-containing protein [Paenibacillus sabuli]